MLVLCPSGVSANEFLNTSSELRNEKLRLLQQITKMFFSLSHHGAQGGSNVPQTPLYSARVLKEEEDQWPEVQVCHIVFARYFSLFFCEADATFIGPFPL